MTSSKGKWIGTSELEARLMANKDDAGLRRDALGQSLRRIYQDVVREKVPDELTELMRKLDHMP
ncbi:NepR family anti-sigma factor [Parvibaculum sp.]|uniref:NepR family anti-sigma factor n=1 Tax=Parvibaculum sp. TaxID=2024848 RepID=UPI00320ED03F